MVEVSYTALETNPVYFETPQLVLDWSFLSPRMVADLMSTVYPEQSP